jgi:hypothetical protein
VRRPSQTKQYLKTDVARDPSQFYNPNHQAIMPPVSLRGGEQKFVTPGFPKLDEKAGSICEPCRSVSL